MFHYIKTKSPAQAGLLAKLRFPKLSTTLGNLRIRYLPSKEFSLARVAGPRIPVPAVRPEGARISEAYFSWNLTTAALVANPNKIISYPEDPGPEDKTLVLGS